jgi:hypothetical protein
MKALLIVLGIAGTLVLTGCHSLPPGAEPGPHGTMAYLIQIEASDPGAKVEVNGEYIGDTPVRLKMFGDSDATFHDFGSPYYVVRALPKTTNQFVQTRVFHTGHMFGPEDRIPERLYFDMNQNTPVQATPGYPPAYYAPPPVIYYPDPWYYGPSYRFHFGGPGFYHHRRR